MHIKCVKELEKSLLGDNNRIHRFWVYKKMFTPFEIENKFSDESVFEDSKCAFGIIRECVALPGGKIALGIQEIYDEVPDEIDNIGYYEFSEIRLEWRLCDQKMFSDEEDDGENSKCDMKEDEAMGFSYEDIWNEMEPISQEEFESLVKEAATFTDKDWKDLSHPMALRFMKELGMPYDYTYFNDLWYSGYNLFRFLINLIIQQGVICEDIVGRFFRPYKDKIEELNNRVLEVRKTIKMPKTETQ